MSTSIETEKAKDGVIKISQERYQELQKMFYFLKQLKNYSSDYHEGWEGMVQTIRIFFNGDLIGTLTSMYHSEGYNYYYLE